jgi:enolase
MTQEMKNKFEEENKHIIIENDNKVHHKHYSFRSSEVENVSDMLECCKVIKDSGLSIWDHSVDSDQSTIIDIGIGLRANMIILHGFNNRNEKISKLDRYADIILELY